MSTADYALAVSILSFIVSLGGLWWNIWSKFVYPKARLRVNFAVMTVLGEDIKQDFLSLTAVNFGPTDITLYNVISREPKKWNWMTLKRDWQYAIWNPLHNVPGETEFTQGPFSGGLPKKLAVGEQYSSHFTINHYGLTTTNIVDVGFVDIFNRHHWPPRKRIREAKLKVQAHRASLPEHMRRSQ